MIQKRYKTGNPSTVFINLAASCSKVSPSVSPVMHRSAQLLWPLYCKKNGFIYATKLVHTFHVFPTPQKKLLLFNTNPGRLGKLTLRETIQNDKSKVLSRNQCLIDAFLDDESK